MARLEVLSGRFSGKKISLKGKDFLVGREKGKNHLVLPDETVSRRHIRFRIEGDQVTVEDLGTSNGTLVDGRKIEGRFALAEGNEIQIGATRFRFLGTGGRRETTAVAPEPEPEPEPEPAAEVAPEAQPVETVRKPRPDKPPARTPSARPFVQKKDRFDDYVARLEAEEREKLMAGGFDLREDFAQRAGAFQILIYLGLLAGGAVIFAVVYLVALQFVAE